MTDSSSNQLISAYVDDRLSPQERAEVEALLESSAEARAELECYRQLRNTLKGLPAEPAPSELLARVMAQAEQESLHGKPLAAVARAEDKGSFRRRWAVPAVSVSVVASLGLLLVVMIQSQPQHDAMENAAATALTSNSADTSPGEVSVTHTGMAEVDFAERGAAPPLEFRDGEKDLGLTDQVQIAQGGGLEGTLSMFSTYDLRTAEVGDVIDGLQVKEDGVVVVHLTVIDRQRVLDTLHVLLSDIPEEAPGANTYGEKKNDYYAVYVQAGEGRLAALMDELRQNEDIGQMLVSTAIPSAELNSYVADQGYSDLSGTKSLKERPAKDGKLLPAEEPLDESVAADSPENGENNRKARPFSADKEPASFDAELQKKPRNFSRSVVRSNESELPPAPPSPEPLGRESAPASRPARMPLADNGKFNYPERLADLRIPASVGQQLIAPQPPPAERPLPNGPAADRQVEKQNGGSLGQTARRKQNVPPVAGFAGGTKADKRAVRAAATPEPATELKAELASPRPGGATPSNEAKNKAPLLRQKRESRKLQVLFVLTNDAAPATESVPPAPPEAKQPPRN